MINLVLNLLRDSLAKSEIALIDPIIQAFCQRVSLRFQKII